MDCIKEQLTQIVRNFTDKEEGVAEDDKKTDLLSLGIDSTGFVGIIIAVEETFDIEIPTELMLISNMNTVEKIEKVVKELMGERDKKNVNRRNL